MTRHRSLRQTDQVQGRHDPANNAAAEAAAEAARALAWRVDKAVIVVVIPLQDGTSIGEVMTVRNWGQDGNPRCTCGDDTHDHICAHVQAIGHVLRMHANLPFDDEA